jgi:DNA invertase Pin-like site-specific DNA recombinase
MDAKAVAVYLRVSTPQQDLRAQEPDLKAWIQANAADRPVRWYRDTGTGLTMDRPALNRLERDIKAGLLDTLAVWRNDRLGRRAGQLLAFLEDLDGRGIAYISLRDGGFLTGEGAAARMFRHMLAGMAEYESNLISERTRAALEAKRARGESWGGRKKGQRYRLTPEKLRALKALLVEQMPKAQIARQLGLSRSAVYEAIKILSATEPLTR